MNNKRFLKEGGAAGPMKHPFALDSVRTGRDLINFFKNAVISLKEDPGSVKIDGVNVSFKVVGDEKKQFAVDRGSLSPLDIDGVVAGNLEDRFPPDKETGREHGMIKSISNLLNILNSSIDTIEPELTKLGMYDDPTKFMNTEYVSGETNVTKYEKNFLAFHGINQFYEKTSKKGYRPGIERPEWDKRQQLKSLELPYNPATFNDMIDKIKPFAKERDFDVYGSVPTAFKTEPNFNEALSEVITIIFDKSEENEEVSEETKTLKQWLEGAENPKNTTIIVNGKKEDPMTKKVYLLVLNAIQSEIPLSSFIPSPEDARKAVDGAMMYHATRTLGDEVIKSLTSDLGDLDKHEGVVVRDEEKFGYNGPVKITGEFILGGMASPFRKKKVSEEEEQYKKHMVLIPGGFKPPTGGHYQMIMQYANSPEVDKVLLIVGDTGRGFITQQDSIEIFDIYGITSHPKIELKKVSGSPMGYVYQFIGKGGEAETYEDYTFSMGASSKPDKKDDEGADSDRSKAFVKWAEGALEKEKLGVDLEQVKEPPFYASVATGKSGLNLSASTFQNAIKNDDRDLIDDHIPSFVLDTKQKESESENLYLKVMNVLHKDLEEMSVSSNVAGYSLPIGMKNRNKFEHINRRDFAMSLIEEQKLRSAIQHILKTKEEEKRKIKTEEQQLRSLIENIIRIEVKEAKEIAGSSFTGINELGTVLNEIMPKIEIQYKKMRTEKEQRMSFRKHLILYMRNLLNIPIALADISDEYEKLKSDREGNVETQGLEESLNVSEQDTSITFKDKEEPIFATNGEEDEEEEKMDTGADILTGEDPTGAEYAQRAVDSVDTQIINGFKLVKHNKTDRELYVRYLLINALLWLDIYEDEIAGDVSDIESEVSGYEDEKRDISSTANM